MADSRTRAGNIQDESGSSCRPESKKEHKQKATYTHKNTVIEVHEKGTRDK